MNTYKVTVYKEIYEEYLIDANSKDEANNQAITGEAEPFDVTVKESEVLETILEKKRLTS